MTTLFLLFNGILILYQVQYAFGGITIKETDSLGFWPISERTSTPSNGEYTIEEARVIIYYVIGDNSNDFYNSTEKRVIKEAFTKIETATKRCIVFKPASGGASHPLHLTKKGNPNPSICASDHNGYDKTDPANGQTMVIFGGPEKGACLDHPRDLLRYLLNVLGMVDEFRHPNRAKVLNFGSNLDTLVADGIPADMFDSEREDEVLQHLDDVDLRSATMIDGRRYAKNDNTPIFTPKNGDMQLSDSLSYGDCVTLQSIYGCEITCERDQPSGFTGDLEVVKINSDIHCTDDAGDFKNGIVVGRVQFKDKLLPPAIASYTIVRPVVGVKLEATADKRAANIVLTKYAPGTKITLDIRANSSTSISAQSRIPLPVNCLPKVRFQSEPLQCFKNGTAVTNGVAETNCDADETKRLEFPVPCKELKSSSQQVIGYFLPQGLNLGPISAEDPDKSPLLEVVFEEQSVSSTRGPDAHWRIMKTGLRWMPKVQNAQADMIKPNGEANITLSVGVLDHESYVKYKIPLLIKCAK